MLNQFRTAIPDSPAEAASAFAMSAFAAYRNGWKDAITARMREATSTADAELGACIDYCLAREGKLIRPVLTLIATEIAEGAPDDAIDYACAVELTHISSLILDDLPCMDNSQVRRGRASLHVKFGEALAMLTGIFFLCTAFKLVSQSGAQSSRAVCALASSIADNGMILGQIKDLQKNANLDTVRYLKTGTLIEAAAALGVLAANGDEMFLSRVTKFARSVGLTFQIRDDVLDGDAGYDCQARAERDAAALAKSIRTEFGDTPAASALSAIAIFAANRRQ